MPTVPIKASLKFLANLDEPLVYIPSKGGGDATDHVGNFMMQEVDVLDGRMDMRSSGLDVEGFQDVVRESFASVVGRLHGTAKGRQSAAGVGKAHMWERQHFVDRMDSAPRGCFV